MNAYKTTIKLLVSNGYILKRRGGNHDIFFNPRSKITIPRSEERRVGKECYS